MNELVMVVAAWAFFLAALDFLFLVIAGHRIADLEARITQLEKDRRHD